MQSGYFQKVMIFGVFLFGVIFFLVLNFTNPTLGVYAFVSFFISLFLLILCFVALFSFLIKKKLTNNEIIFKNVRESFRQGLLASLFVIAVLGLAAVKLLTWWDSALLAISLFLLELYFKSEKQVGHE